MSRRKRRNSRRRKSSSSSKQSISPYNIHKHTKTLVDTVAYGEETAEKGEMDSLCKENFLSESKDEKEVESPTKEKKKKSRQGSYEDFSKHKMKKASISELEDRHLGLKINSSVTVDDFGQSPRVVFEQCHEISVRGKVSCVITIISTEFNCMTLNMKVEINEVVTSDNSDVKTTVMFQNNKEKGGEIYFRSQTEKHQTPTNTHLYSWKQHGTDYENICYKISITELSTESKDAAIRQSSWVSPEDVDCHKSCCKNNFCSGNTDDQSDTDFTLVDGSSCCSSHSDFWQPQKHLSLPTSLSSEALWAIPPPDEFADKKSNMMNDLAEDVALCCISPSKNVIDHNESKCTLTKSEGTLWQKLRCQDFLDKDNRANYATCCDQLYNLSPREHLFMNPRVPIRRSSFTKYFSHNYEMNRHLRHNSIAILETKAHPLGHMDMPPKRRNTFPGEAYYLNRVRENILSYRESFSSGSLSSLFMQSLSTQAERRGRFYIEDERLCPFRFETCKSSSSINRPSSTNSLNLFVPKCKAYSTFKNSLYSQRSDESPKEVFVRDEQYHRPTNENEDLVIIDTAMFVCGVDLNKKSAGQLKWNKVTEGGFDKGMLELYETNSVGDTIDSQLTIHVIPPSSCNSEEHIKEVVPNKLKLNTWEDNEAQSPKKKRGSIMTEDCKQRFPRGSSNISTEILQEFQIEALSTTNKSPTGPPIQEMELESVREAKNTESSLLINTYSQHPGEPLTIKFTKENNKEITNIPADKVSHQTKEALNKTSTDICWMPKLYKNDLSGWQSDSKNSLEIKEHLRPPTGSIYKESEENLDHWARRSKLFKESKQLTSAGESSITSNITEESDTMNSEDTLLDMSMRDIEDRGFYTETFHSAPWIFRGDDVIQNENPHCLSNRTRPAAIRERTVKIRKGIGEYPWGFRIQYSKPIVVTEVDTNGAAEEAGLQVGDYVLAVNGTDVTGVPHSKAADLARQGPDLLTLTIGSDIGQTPNTARPACRGYLHKRTQSSLLKGWRKRWFVLRHDCCLYYYKNKRNEGKSRALCVVSLEGAVVEGDTSLGKPFVFKCCPVSGNRVYYFCATSNQEMKRWLDAMGRAVHPITQNHVWVDVTRHNSSLPPLAVKNPECIGLLHQLDRNKDSWVQHYCVLKDGCLYFYVSIRSACAIGGIYLHGYTVKDQPLGSKRSTIELRPPSEEFKAFYLSAENANENKRWICAIKSSIGKWLPLHQAIQDYMSRPPEETRM